MLNVRTGPFLLPSFGSCVSVKGLAVLLVSVVFFENYQFAEAIWLTCEELHQAEPAGTKVNHLVGDLIGRILFLP